MIQSVLYVALGGALGSAARFVVSRLVQEHVSTPFPLPTMAVNIVGCLLIGLVYGFAARHEGLGDGMKLFLTVGFCGGFTTFSTFCNEGLALMRGDHFVLAALYAQPVCHRPARCSGRNNNGEKHLTMNAFPHFSSPTFI